MNTHTLSLGATDTLKENREKVKTSPKIKRYNLSMPDDLYTEIQDIADRRAMSVVDVIRKFVQIGLIVDHASVTPNTKILIRENNVDREIVLV